MSRHDPGPVFRALHQKGNPFVLVNVWDKGSARLMEALGAEAIATSSGAHAFTLGRPDMGTITRDEALSHAADLVASTTIPVSGDFENGFGESPETCAETVRLAAEAGLAGISIEDTALPGTDAYDLDLAAERIRAAAAAARALARDFVLVARADGILTGTYDLSEAKRRLKAFDAAGADCLYAPMPGSFADLKSLVMATDLPFNALASGPFSGFSRDQFAEIGVARISLGASLSRLTHRVLLETGQAILSWGDFSVLSGGLPAAISDDLLSMVANKTDL